MIHDSTTESNYTGDYDTFWEKEPLQVLYQWGAVMNWDGEGEPPLEGSKGICPAGWHVPTEDEWNILIDYVSSSVGGNKLKSKTYWDGTVDDKFNALPAGERWGNGTLNAVGDGGFWWSSLFNVVSNNGFGRHVNSGEPYVYSFGFPPDGGASIRCIINGDK
ncbi:MAG: FISUMP domain-containing protein [Bacilli bacterium]|nr:FISUMP domain-containing protein [Bacilli bacterium]